MRAALLISWLALSGGLAAEKAGPSPPAAVRISEFVGASQATPQSHAATLVETPSGLVAAWFGGKQERDPGVGIWVARQRAREWSAPAEVADGVQADGTRLPTWNPVLFRSRTGTLMLFYKVGPDPQHWWGMLKTSRDDGMHWSAARRLPVGVLGPIKNKPVQLADGAIVSPSSTEGDHWTVHFERSTDDGATWRIVTPPIGTQPIEAIQPALLVHRGGELQAIGRSRQDRIFSTRSRDGGRSWSPMRLLDLPNPNSGVDAVVLADGRSLIVYNPTLHGAQWWDGRGQLSVAVSDDGEHWRRVLDLENTPGAEFSYPAVIQTADGLVHIAYTWKRQRIRHVVIDPRKLD
ncbi:glycoside hydrolase [Dyella sp. LX-66]|nr:glycoside hydrolase [Dyella sp. LX-1]MBT2139763.1 glycoside hydrolase [Dyella sp. LX-66]